MAAAVPWALLVGNKEFLFYIVVMAGMIAAVTAVHFRVTLSTGTLFALSLWGLLHMAGGLVPTPAGWPISGDAAVLYSLWLSPFGPKYDQVVHAFGFGVLTCVCWQSVRPLVGGKNAKPTFGLMLVCAAASTGFGALNEVVEFSATRLFAKTNVGGYENTGWDLVANLIGAVLAALCIRIAYRQPALSGN